MDTKEKGGWTPGPWEAVEWVCHAPTTVKSGEVVVAKCSGNGLYAKESLANARLISKAPEMAELLRRWVQNCRSNAGVIAEMEAATEKLLAEIGA